MGNVKAQVNADIDFSLVELTSEQHRPNQSVETSAVRSQQTVEDGTGATAARRCARRRHQPAAGDRLRPPSTAPAAPLGAAGNSDAYGPSRRESVINYEVDKTVKVVREASGTIAPSAPPW